MILVTRTCEKNVTSKSVHQFRSGREKRKGTEDIEKVRDRRKEEEKSRKEPEKGERERNEERINWNNQRGNRKGGR
jgi:hypothetical protein